MNRALFTPSLELCGITMLPCGPRPDLPPLGAVPGAPMAREHPQQHPCVSRRRLSTLRRRRRGTACARRPHTARPARTPPSSAAPSWSLGSRPVLASPACVPSPPRSRGPGLHAAAPS
eukprot:5246113-Prymnesium_polylepis.1